MSETTYTNVEVTMAGGNVAVWGSDDWDDYIYDGKCFIVKKNGAWVGIYNMNFVVSVVVK